MIPRDVHGMPFRATGGSSDGDVIQIYIPLASVSVERKIVVSFADPELPTYGFSIKSTEEPL